MLWKRGKYSRTKENGIYSYHKGHEKNEVIKKKLIFSSSAGCNSKWEVLNKPIK